MQILLAVVLVLLGSLLPSHGRAVDLGSSPLRLLHGVRLHLRTREELVRRGVEHVLVVALVPDVRLLA